MRSPCPWFLLRRVPPEQTRQETPTHRCDAEDPEIVVPKALAGATLGGKSGRRGRCRSLSGEPDEQRLPLPGRVGEVGNQWFVPATDPVERVRLIPDLGRDICLR